MKDFYQKTARVGIVPACIRMIEDPKRAWWQRLLLALTPLFIVWVISPLDILPEVFLGPLGLADDSVLLVTMFLLIRLAVSFYSEKRYVKPNNKYNDKDVIDL